MKCFRRCLCVLLCCLLLSAGFSIVASAEEVPLQGYIVEASYEFESASGLSYGPYGYWTFNPGNGIIEKHEPRYNLSNGFYEDEHGTMSWFTKYRIYNEDGSFLIDKGDPVTVSIDNVYASALWYDGEYSFYIPNIDYVGLLVKYADGSYEYVDYEYYAKNGKSVSADFYFQPSYDVVEMELFVDLSYYCRLDCLVGYFQVYFGEYNGDGGFSITVDAPTKTEGLLTRIWDKCKDIGANIADGFRRTVDSIVNLPDKLWDKISEGLKNLFIPDEDYIVDYKSRMEELLAEKFGAIYQVVDVTFESWDRISDADEQNTILFPETTIPITNDTSFTFGGYEVQIVPDGFDFLVTAVKTMCGIACTVLFVNGLRKRYDEVMGVEK